MNRQEIVKFITQEKLVAIVRTKDQSESLSFLKNLIEAGVKVMEVTSNTPGWAETIKKIRELNQNSLIGAGTVVNPDIAKEAIAAGAQFLVSPNVHIESH